jgi:hypothetical protein
VTAKRPSDYQYGFDGMSHARMLEKMQSAWKSSETPCGRGSEIEMTILVRALLPVLMADYDLHSLNDAGAGDLHWMAEMEWDESITYKGFDLVPRHEDVEEFDITTEYLPYADLVLCRHVLNHLSPRLAMNALDNFIASGSRYLLITNCDNQVTYWEACNLKLRAPINTWKDATKWWLELHDMHEPNLYHHVFR